MKNNTWFATNGLSDLNLLREETHSGTCRGYSKMWFVVLLLVVLMAGCGGSGSSGGDNNAPTVSSTVPADLATGVAIDANITATFSNAMDSSTITTTTFTVTTGPDLTPIEGNVSLAADGVTAVFVPTSYLAADTIFTATLTTEVKDLNGKALAAAKVWSFTTGATLSPTVVSTDPPNFATGVATDKIISANFSVAMDPLTIINENFTVAAGPGPDLTPVEGTVAYDAITKIATFTPTGGLAPNTHFLARVTTGVKDLSGNAMKEDTVWEFQTGP